MIPHKAYRTPVRSRIPTAGNFPNYLVPGVDTTQNPSLLSPGQLPNDREAAKGLGVDTHELHEEIRTEEQQRHFDAPGDDKHTKSVPRVAEKPQ